MRITIVGSGNVATHMGAAFKNAGHQIIQVYSRDMQNAALLAYHIGAEAVDNLDAINPETDMFIISVKDDAITPTAQTLAQYKKLIVHTSGVTDLEALSAVNPEAGVLYPLQTFSKIREVDFNSVPLCIEGAGNDITLLLEQLAQTISKNVYRVNSDQRRVLHLAAVFACNFPNYLYGVARDLLAKQNLEFEMLRPLILETAQKVQNHLPQEVQTGPAERNDQNTMAAHLQMLHNEPLLQELYNLLSQAIIKNDNGGQGRK
ncbi:MAG TPA: Rossmann-like and DUF2520 domain-containing protein [Mucilaginibacter sp.]|jgi:predicted short-subunit dehydrogenase-like oxidoreductase (DUF2520 family)|nr:Rossmann-like and DUF2520 domain-containing protein [Mucilaginibacter sp.]